MIVFRGAFMSKIDLYIMDVTFFSIRHGKDLATLFSACRKYMELIMNVL